MVTGAKLATLVASAVGFGAVAGLVMAAPVGARATATTATAGTPVQQAPAPSQAADFFAVPPGFMQPPIVGGGSAGQGGTSGSQGGFGSEDGFGGQMPGLRTGGS
jgi:hypothetical protein